MPDCIVKLGTLYRFLKETKEKGVNMAEQIIEDFQLISISQLIRAIIEGRNNSERFCFIIGSGASVSSGIPTGITLEYQWMKEMEETSGLEEIHEVAKSLKNYLEHDFANIKRAWEKTKQSGIPLPSEYYFDIYKLRFFPNHRNGYHYLEKIMANKNPGFGYHPLALMLTDGSGSNLVITTNFDSLLEDALFLYTDDKPLVINHEALAEYAGDPNIKRPIIAKVHRGIFFDPLNQPEEINELKGRWNDVLASVFQKYTPIVIGYGGGDNSLMNLLEDGNIKMRNGIYWCYFEKDGLPNDKIQTLIKEKNGYLVRTAGFDATMLAIGNALFPDKIGIHEAEEYLNKRTSMRIANYEKEYKKLIEAENLNDKENAEKGLNQSENEFKMEIEKMTKRAAVSEKERRKLNRMTAWDYKRQGNRYYDLKQYDNAVKSYSNAIRIQSNIAQFYNDRGCSYVGLEEYDKAISDYDKGIELNSEYADAYNNRGVAYRGLKKYDKAISDYNKTIELNPEYAEAYNNRGNVYSVLREYDKAISDYNKAIELNSEYAKAYYNRGNAYDALKEYDKAISDYNTSIELNPEYADSYYNRGNVYNILKQYYKAISDYNKAIELNPEYVDAYNNRGVAYRVLKKYDKAISDYNKTIELNPEYAEAYNNRGSVYNVLKEYDKAVSDYNKAIQLNPKFAEPYKNQGVIWKKRDNFEKSIYFLTKAIELNPKSKNAYTERAKVYRLMGETSKAKSDEATAAKL